MITFLFIIIVLLTYIYVGVSSSFILGVSYLLGIAIISFFVLNKEKEKELYSVLFCVGALYMFACFLYKKAYGYDWLLAFDTYNYFIPQSKKYIEGGNCNYIDVVQFIFKDFNLFSQNQYAYWVYSCLWGVVAFKLDADYYFTLQNSTLFLYPFVGVVLYKIFRKNRFSINLSFKYTILICLCSSIFYYSSQILRDIHILLFYLLAILITFNKEFSIKNLITLFCIVIITSFFRIESGVFLALLIPLYLFLYLKRKNTFYIIVIVLLFAVLFIYYLFLNFSDLQMLFDTNQEFYELKAETSTGVLAYLQKIPLLGDVLSIIYNAVLPIPCWSRLSPSDGAQYGWEAYNIMGFVRIFSAFFNLIVVVFVCRFLFRKNIFSQFSSPLKWHLLIGFVFLLLQANVISQRRLLAYYCVFYIVFLIIYSLLKPNERKRWLFISILMFFVLQFLGAIYLM